ncbi:MAG: hypothetical protein Q4D82_06640 [Neisseria sp.]|nr:hypothetical protein [Neisseria sp.]
MEGKRIGKVLTGVRFKRNKSTMILLEVFLLALLVGISRKSWQLGCGLLSVLLVLVHIRRPALIFSLGFSILWGMLAYGFAGVSDSFTVQTVSGVLVFLVSLGLHWTGLEK